MERIKPPPSFLKPSMNHGREAVRARLRIKLRKTGVSTQELNTEGIISQISGILAGKPGIEYSPVELQASIIQNQSARKIRQIQNPSSNFFDIFGEYYINSNLLPSFLFTFA
jgi:hypothetical protein